MNIPMANEKVTMISFFHGLRYGPLKEKLVLEPANTPNDLSKFVIQYIKLEKVKLLAEQMTEIRSGNGKVADEGPRRSPRRTRVWDHLQNPKEREPFKRLRVRSSRIEEGRIRKPQELMFNNYTHLRTTVGKVYAQVEDKKIYSRPQKIKAPPNRRDHKKYCEYHKNHGHDTDECRILNSEIERLVRRGQLKEFVKADQCGSPGRPRELSPRQRQGGNTDASPRITGRVDTFSGGITGGGDTSNVWRRYAHRSVYALSLMATIYKEPISFSDNELVGLELPHDDPLMTSPIIANFVVARMLVVDRNRLIGRPLLNALRAIVSLLHLKMKFPTSGGVEKS
ncbi:hypothetical protein LIER_43836 [Lithospermum erythrorhizon]|uniref:Reverse transcriptase domain-containing protein n=1 Tax=Lithospermum erythrorhizon TaxID=34254 RepID=A0AAV3R0X1_LITER